MCGICGIAYGDRRPVDVDRLTAMRDLLSHRGPDGAGQWTAPGVGLGHRRLSVIDLSGGAQPLANEDETVWVTFNGEIYNYRDLRDELIGRGHRFRTRSDTEVLVHGYEEWGANLPSRLNGIFAFALYDLRQERLLVVRDQLGVKPLFYSQVEGGLFFASEIKSVLEGAGIQPTMSSTALQEYLMFRYAAHERTFYEGVHRLAPGHMMIRDAGGLEIRRYWAPPRRTDFEANLDVAVEELDHLLRRAVERQMMSDVPLGAFCSGGVDSGLTTAYAATASSHPLHTFSVGFNESAWDESDLARNTSDRFGTAHHTTMADSGDIPMLLQRLIWYNDEPLSHPNSVPLYQLSRMARERVTVVLTGEGADELFAGYPRHHVARLASAFQRVPGSIRSRLGALLQRLPSHRAGKAGDLLPLALDRSIVLNSAYVMPEVVERVTRSSVEEALEPRLQLARETLDPHDPIGSITRYDTLTYLVCALDRMDRMSMAVGLEARVPFLDIDLVGWALRLDARLRASGTHNKRVLKQLAERYLDPRITRGRKSGFGLPLDDWFRQPTFAPIMDRLADGSHPAADALDGGFVRRLVTEHRLGSHAHGELLWLLTNVVLWQESAQRSESGADLAASAMSR